MLLLLLACGTEPSPAPTPGEVCDFGDDLPSCDVADACMAGDTGNRADCQEALAWSWSCDADWRAGDGGTTQDGLIYAGGIDGLPYSHAALTTITDADTWAALLAGVEGSSTWPTVDFATDLVVIAQLYVNSTCGMELLRHGVWVPTGGAEYPVEVYAEWEDSSGSCHTVCDMEMRSAVIYAVPRSRGWPEVCSDVINRCE